MGYTAHENCPEPTHSNNVDHVDGIRAWHPPGKRQIGNHANTLKTVLEKLDFNETWGWDFPMLAMTGPRLGRGSGGACLLMGRA